MYEHRDGAFYFRQLVAGNLMLNSSVDPFGQLNCFTELEDRNNLLKTAPSENRDQSTIVAALARGNPKKQFLAVFRLYGIDHLSNECHTFALKSVNTHCLVQF